MSNSHTIFPFRPNTPDDQGATEFLKTEMVFSPEFVPPGRWPTRAELRQSIQALGYSLVH